MGALSDSAALRVLVLAGEPSGDRHGAHLVRALRQRGPCEAFGLAGPEMRAAGVEPLVPMEEVSVLGLTEVLARLPALWRARSRLVAALDRRPDVVVPIDFPGFNLPFARRARARGTRVLYYVSPQIWAWGRGRLAEMGRAADHVAVVFPFEVPLYRNAGIPVTYVGHPLVEELDVDLSPAELRRRVGLEPDRPYLALLPGSRDQEVDRCLGPMIEAVRALSVRRPELAAVVAAASPRLAERIRARMPRAGRVSILSGHTHAVAAHARAAIVTSGTATLETAALGTPLVIVYRLSWLSWQLARRLVHLPRIGLANIVAGEEVAPELLQGQATGGAIANALAPFLDDGPERQRALARLGRVREELGGPGASARVAELVWRLSGRALETPERARVAPVSL